MVDLSVATALTYRESGRTPDGWPEGWYERLRRALLFLPQVNRLQVFAADGRLEYDSHRSDPARRDAANERFFHAHQLQRMEFVLDRPLRQGGRWLIPMSRRIDGEDGAFAGVLRALVDVGYFAEFYSQAESGEVDRALLFDHDGTVLVNWTPRQPSGPVGGLVGELLPLAGPSGPPGLRVTEDDQTLVALSQLPDFPLSLAVARSKQAVLAPWYNGLRTTLAGLALLATATGGFLWLSARQARQRCEIDQTLRLFQRALEASTSGVLITERGRGGEVGNPIVYANNSFTRLTGYELADVMGRDPRFLHAHDRDQPALDLIRSALEREEPVRTVLRNYRRDGSPYWSELLIAPVRNDHGRVTHFLGVQRDVSEQRRAAEERERMNRELAASNDELEQFAYVASHDLQQPLRTVSNYLQLLERHLGTDIDEDARTFISFAVDGAKRMHELIVDLLEFSRISRRGSPFQPIATVQVMAEAQKDLGSAVAEAEAVVLADDLPPVHGDPSQIRRLFENLIGNAIKYRSPDRRPEVRVTVQKLNGFWQFCVADNGIGIPHDELERVFLIFQRLHGRDEYPGSGIGLAVCRKIVERHGGRIWAESELGQGSRFYFTLPEVVPPLAG
jgi:PAS domain S-box-containing protein